MNKSKTAVMIDTCTDVPDEIIEEYGMYLIPLNVLNGDKVYLDKVDITPEEVYDMLNAGDFPTTSLPNGEIIRRSFQKMIDDGYENVIVVTLSSGLSGTYNFVKVLGEEFEDKLNIHYVDTKNIAIASGLTAIIVAKELEKGISFEEAKELAVRSCLNTKVFFYVDTLKYLQKGGRIGLVTALVGSRINLKPIISCNDEGIYYNAGKAIGKKKALTKLIDMAADYISGVEKYNLAICHGDAAKTLEELKDTIFKKIPNYEFLCEAQIGPVLGVHTGPGLIGIGVQKLDNILV